MVSSSFFKFFKTMFLQSITYLFNKLTKFTRLLSLYSNLVSSVTTQQVVSINWISFLNKIKNLTIKNSLFWLFTSVILFTTELLCTSTLSINPVNALLNYTENSSSLFLLFYESNNSVSFLFEQITSVNTSSIVLFMFIFSSVFFCFTTFLSLIFSSYLGLYGIYVFNLVSLASCWISTLFLFFDTLQFNQFYKINFGVWFHIFANLKIPFEFYLDTLSITYVMLITTISIFVQLYTFSYFRYEPLTDRLIIFLNLFIISMVFLVTSSNLIMIFLGWEMIGLTSFVLINFWVTRKGTLKAAFKAFTFNKFSDVCFFFFILILFLNLNELDVVVLNSQAYTLYFTTFSFLSWDLSVLELADFFLLLTACVKSAQIGGHLWLPDSMEAPVPASALIHSATLVSAGIFLLLRFHVFFELSSVVYYLIPIFGALTSFYGGLGALYQSDIKRILAYSTISHCGFLMISFSTYLTDYTLFYLYIHGFFKACVFLCVGNVIRFGGNYQDFRRMGSFYKYLPFEHFLILVGLFNLGGLPFSLGFYMKHFFFISLNNYFYLNLILQIFCLLGALTGLFYSFRLYYYVFFDFKKAKKYVYLKAFSSKLESKFSSNTSLASNIAILGLFFSAYVISLACFFFLKNSYLTLTDYTTVYNTNWINLILLNANFLWNMGYLNWIILLNCFFLILNFWRKNINTILIYNTTLTIVLFNFNMFVFMNILLF